MGISEYMGFCIYGEIPKNRGPPFLRVCGNCQIWWSSKNGPIFRTTKKRPENQAPEKRPPNSDLKMAFFRTWEIRPFLAQGELDISYFFIFYWGYIWKLHYIITYKILHFTPFYTTYKLLIINKLYR